MFGSRALEKALAAALSLNSDLKQEIADLREERRELLNRIMALTNPGALREASRTSFPSESVPPVSQATDTPQSHAPLPHKFPGNDVWKPPSRPPTPPTPRMPFTPPEPKKEVN